MKGSETGTLAPPAAPTGSSTPLGDVVSKSAGTCHGLMASRLATMGFRVLPPARKLMRSPWVGTVDVLGTLPCSRCPSYETKKNVLSFQIGPPSDPPN